MKSSCPATLDTLTISVPPAVMLATVARAWPTLDLDDFVGCYNQKNRHERKPTWSEKNEKGRWRAYKYEDLIKRDKINLDIFWLKTKPLKTPPIFPPPKSSPPTLSKTSKPPSPSSPKSRLTQRNNLCQFQPMISF
jgi:hypothetical protein